MHTYIHKYIHTWIHICIHKYIQTYIRINMHTYMHTYITNKSSANAITRVFCLYWSLKTVPYWMLHSPGPQHPPWGLPRVIFLSTLIRAESIGEGENNANIEMDKIANWARDNKIKFNEEKSKIMLLTRRKRKNRLKLQCTWTIRPSLKYRN